MEADIGNASDRGLTAAPASEAAPAMDGSSAATVSAEEHEMEGGMGDGGSGAAKTGENEGIGGGGGSGPMGARDGVRFGGGGLAGAAAGGAGGGAGSGGRSAGPSGGTDSGTGGGNASALAPAPALALLKGTLSYNADLRRHLIRGMWSYENSTEFPPQRFELIRTLAPDEEVATIPKDGEFHGSFSIAYHHTTTKGKKKERTKVVAESGVKITFTRIDKDKGSDDGGENDGNSNVGDNSNRVYDVAGQGNNQFGVFTIRGKATGLTHEDDLSYNVELRKTYGTGRVPDEFLESDIPGPLCPDALVAVNQLELNSLSVLYSFVREKHPAIFENYRKKQCHEEEEMEEGLPPQSSSRGGATAETKRSRKRKLNDHGERLNS